MSDESIEKFRIGFAPDEWRSIFAYGISTGFSAEILRRAGLVKRPPEGGKAKDPYDVFRGRVMFPLSDAQGRAVAFSGRAVGDTAPKYLNSPDTELFTKSELLYGLDKAKEEIRKKDYSVLVEGQLDLVLSHQAGVKNTVASSGTAFTEKHLLRLKKLSGRIILAFDGDDAGKKAAEKSAALGLLLGLDVKIARLPEGKDPADLVRESPETWKEALRNSKHAIEAVLLDILESEKDNRKVAKAVALRVLPMIGLIQSSIERAHFVSVVAKKTGMREDAIWEDVKRIPRIAVIKETAEVKIEDPRPLKSRRELIEENLSEVLAWQKELDQTSEDRKEALMKEEKELRFHLEIARLEEERERLRAMLRVKEHDDEIVKEIESIGRKIDEAKRKVR